MNPRLPRESDAELLAAPVAARLLTRASELDAVHRAGTGIAELRSAAAEAGISTSAFDAALAELRVAERATVSDAREQPPRHRRMGLLIGVAATIALSLLVLSRAVSVSAGPPATLMVEEAFLLRCLQPGEAAELIRPLLGLRTNSIVYSPTNAPRVLTVHATPAQIAEVRSLLERHEGAASPSCRR